LKNRRPSDRDVYASADFTYTWRFGEVAEWPKAAVC
jgi:hypothetical protein